MKACNESQEPNMLPGRATLDTWVADEWRDGVQIDNLEELQTLSVETRHHTYEMTVIDPKTAEVLVRGGELFPEHRPARVSGASLGSSFLKLRGIYVGFKLELMVDGRRIITSKVRRINLHQPGEFAVPAEERPA